MSNPGSYTAYFKKASPTIGLDAAQNQMLMSLVGHIDTLTTNLAGEVTRAELAEGTLTTDLATATSTLSAGITGAAADASAALASATSTLLAGITGAAAVAADALEAEATALEALVAGATGALAARIAAENVFFDTFAQAVYLSTADGAEFDYTPLGVTGGYAIDAPLEGTTGATGPIGPF